MAFRLPATGAALPMVVALTLLASGVTARAQIMVVGMAPRSPDRASAAESSSEPPGAAGIAIYDLRMRPAAPKLLATLPMAAAAKAPRGVAIAPGGEIALVTGALEGADPQETPGNKGAISVIDLTARPPRPIAAIAVGEEPASIAISRKADLALVADAAGGTIGVLAIEGKNVALSDTIQLGGSVESIAITPDGKHALAVKPQANKVAWLDIDGHRVSYGKYDMTVGPFPTDATVAGATALVSSNGAVDASDGGVDTAAVIDLAALPPRVVDVVALGDAPHRLAVSPRGNLAVAVLVRGSNADPQAFYWHRNGSLALLRVDGKRATKVSEVEVGAVPDAAAFSPDGKYLYVGDRGSGDIAIFKVEGTKLVETGRRLETAGRPVSLSITP